MIFSCLFYNNYKDNLENNMNTKEKGKRGEDLAVEFLKKLGYQIKKRNFHFGKTGEIDIIAQEKNVLVFVEVKMRGSDAFGDPLLSITPAKQKALRKTAEGYLYVNKIYDMECRFDIITIDIRFNPEKIEHLINAL